MIDYYDCSPIEPRLVEICKGHLLCEEDKCLRCRISKNNRTAHCYKPVLLSRDYEGRDAIREIYRQKREARGVDGT